MSEEPISAVERAINLLNARNFAEALEISRSLLVTDPANSQAKLVEAIALSNMGNRSDAAEAFESAIALDPSSTKARFNAAVHEYNAGDLHNATKFAEETLDLDPSYQPARDLIQRMKGSKPAEIGEVSYPRQSASEFDQPYENVDIVRSLGSKWIVIGWCLSILSCALILMPLAKIVSSGVAPGAGISIGNLGLGYVLAGVLVNGLSIIWMVMDIIHRRGPFGWLVGHIPAGCLGLGFITLPLYILLGRK